MSIIQKISSIIAILIGLFIFSIGYLANIDEDLIEHTLENSRKIDAVFRASSNYINEYKILNGQFPSREEFSYWIKVQAEQNQYKELLSYSTNGFSEEVVNAFGKPDKESYLLSVWRGEWYEYYASWADKNTLTFDRKEYYILKSKWLGFALMSAVSIILLVGGWYLWPRRTNRCSGPQGVTSL